MDFVNRAEGQIFADFINIYQSFPKAKFHPAQPFFMHNDYAGRNFQNQERIIFSGYFRFIA